MRAVLAVDTLLYPTVSSHIKFVNVSVAINYKVKYSNLVDKTLTSTEYKRGKKKLIWH